MTARIAVIKIKYFAFTSLLTPRHTGALHTCASSSWDRHGPWHTLPCRLIGGAAWRWRLPVVGRGILTVRGCGRRILLIWPCGRRILAAWGSDRRILAVRRIRRRLIAPWMLGPV